MSCNVSFNGGKFSRFIRFVFSIGCTPNLVFSLWYGLMNCLPSLNLPCGRKIDFLVVSFSQLSTLFAEIYKTNPRKVVSDFSRLRPHQLLLSPSCHQSSQLTCINVGPPAREERTSSLFIDLCFTPALRRLPPDAVRKSLRTSCEPNQSPFNSVDR